MKNFAQLDFNPKICRQQLNEFQELLQTRQSLGELDDILPFFKELRHLAAFISSYNPNIIRRDRIAFEYDIFGDFKSDLVVGDSVTHSYCFIEFEDASANSIYI